MGEALLYLISSFWLGAVHAATPGHGKTIAAAYIVGARGRPIDAIILGIFVTLSHTSGIVLVAILASLGLPGLIPQRVEAYLALFTGILVIVMGVWMFFSQRRMLSATNATMDHSQIYDHNHDHDQSHVHEVSHDHDHTHERNHDHGHDPTSIPTHDHKHEYDQAHNHDHEREEGIVYHSHGWGIRHTHRMNIVTENRPNLLLLLGLGIAGGLLPDPAALAILLSALAGGKVILGLATVLVFSIGFASTLVVVGIVAAKVGQVILTWLSGPWAMRVQAGTALLIVIVGIILTTIAWRTVNALP
jgi:nickel/cobalt exporter